MKLSNLDYFKGGLFFISGESYILIDMKTFVVYKEESDHARAVTDFLRDFERQTGHVLESVDPESRDGISRCEAYGIVEYPSVVAIDNNGVLQNIWRGLPLPTISEVSYYAAQN